MGVFRRYDQDAKLAVYYAAHLAPQRRKASISPEELLLGLTWRQHAANCEFRALKDQFAEIWGHLGMPHLPITSIPWGPGKLPLNAEAKRILRAAKRNADGNGDYWIDVDHLLCALISEGGTAGNALIQSGWTLERVREAGRRGRERYPPKSVSKWTRFATAIAIQYESLGTLGPLLVFATAILLGALVAHLLPASGKPR